MMKPKGSSASLGPGLSSVHQWDSFLLLHRRLNLGAHPTEWSSHDVIACDRFRMSDHFVESGGRREPEMDFGPNQCSADGLASDMSDPLGLWQAGSYNWWLSAVLLIESYLKDEIKSIRLVQMSPSAASCCPIFLLTYDHVYLARS